MYILRIILKFFCCNNCLFNTIDIITGLVLFIVFKTLADNGFFAHVFFNNFLILLPILSVMDFGKKGLEVFSGIEVMDNFEWSDC